MNFHADCEKQATGHKGENTMGFIKRSQIAGMNIHYMNYSLDYFLDAQERAGFESIELWGGKDNVLRLQKYRSNERK